MKSVFILHHVHQFKDGEEDVKLIGVYASREDAEAAISRLSDQPGFKDLPEGFHIEEYEVGKDHFSEGFISGAEAIQEDTEPGS